MLYKFGSFILDASERLLWRDGELLAITPKAFDILQVLIEKPGHLVEKHELLEKVWPGKHVDEHTLSQYVFTLRKALGQLDSGQQYIQTVTKKGYRFVAAVEVISGPETTENGLAVADVCAQSGSIEDRPWAADAGPSVNARPLPANEMVRDGREIKVRAEPAFLSSPMPPQRRRSVKDYIGSGRLWMLCLAVLLMVAMFSLAWERAHRWPLFKAQAEPFQNVKIENVTSVGNTWAAAVSHDGDYVAYVTADQGSFSLWLKRIDMAGERRLIGPQEAQILDLTFSPDDKFIFYNRGDEADTSWVLEQIPMLGGEPRQLLRNVNSKVTFSPDGSRLAFIRDLSPLREVALIVANSDGTREEAIATRKQPLYFTFGGPAWSPDGKTIACAAAVSGGFTSVVEIRLEDRTERAITGPLWFMIGKIVWLTDGRGLIISGSRGEKFSMQLWRIAYPGGEATQITDDLSDYIDLSIAADSKLLIAVQSDQILEVFVSSKNDLSRGRRLTASGGKFNSVAGFSWTPDNQILYASNAGGNANLWMMDMNGGNRRQLTLNPHSDIFPTASPDGNRIAFISDRSGSNQLWVMDLNGSYLKQLTKDDPRQNGAKVHLHWSPDSRWLIYTLYADQPTLWKIPVEGGNPVQITTSYSYGGAISPDGKLIAYCSLDDRTKKAELIIADADRAHVIKQFDMLHAPYGGQIQWMPDGKAISYVVNLAGQALLLNQDLAGGPPQELLNLRSGLIEFFAWSPDGNDLVYSNSIKTYDVSKVRDLR